MATAGSEFWAKTADCKQPHPFKSLIHHGLDIAATASALAMVADARFRRRAHHLGVSLEQLRGAFACFAGWHDLGKAARAFQAKAPDLFPAAFGALREGETGAGFNHGRATTLILFEKIPELMARVAPNLSPYDHLEIAKTIGGHHGRPIDYSPGRCDARTFAREIGAPAIEAARRTADDVWRQLGEPVLALGLDDEDRLLTQICWDLAGFVTLADWVGSDADIFRFEDPTMPAEDYWLLAEERAHTAVRRKGLAPPRIAGFGGVRALFDNITTPTPMQTTAEDVALPPGPTLVIVEDSAGSGKTEAAITLAHRMMADGKGEGVYFALPTMATANAMFTRLHDAHRRLFTEGSMPSLALAHGRRDLSDLFSEVRLAGRREDRDDGSVAAECAAWIADDRRRVFFADVGAGTIDQALLAVLPRKHFALRQQGLGGRILIVDEAHGYDAYVGAELRRLLEFHAAAGGSAIVLSATLTRGQRQSFANAWAEGLGASAALTSSTEYPLMTVASAGTLFERHVAAPAKAHRRVAVERLTDWDAALNVVVEAAQAGAAVAVLRNAVDDVIETHRRLAERGCAATLFHARFAMGDRLAIEADIVGTFGRSGEGRAGRVVVASQVLQESLDCDFDLMVTDLAPADLLIQRAGRLWRHERGPRPVTGPRLLVVTPDWRAVNGPRWLSTTQPRGAVIYRIGVQWRTARALFPDGDAGEIASPDGLRALVEAAYDDGVAPPDELTRDDDRRSGREAAERGHARQTLLDWGRGYSGQDAVTADQEIGTRLGDATVTLRLARRHGAGVRPWATDADPVRAWALSEVTARCAWLGGSVDDIRAPDNLTVAIDAARKDWPEFEQAIPVGVVEDGIVRIAVGNQIDMLRYMPDVGLTKVPGMRGDEP